jgi:methyl-accepting chemotaxis protein
MFRKLIGALLLLIGVVGVALSIAGIYFSNQIVSAMGSGLDSTLQLTADSLVTVEDTLALAQTTVGDVNAGLDTVGVTADDLAKTLADTRPLLDQVSQVATEEVPDNIEAMQATIPNMAEVAGVIDDTLVTLNAFKIEESILGIDINYDLGVNYQPAVPFDETVLAMGSSLDSMPNQLRGLQSNIETASDNLATVSDDIYAVSDDLAVINGRIAEVEPLLGDYIDIVGEINGAVTTTREQVNDQLKTVSLALRIGLIWLGLMQFAILYLGWDLIIGERYDVEKLEKEAKEKEEKDE